MAKKAAKKTESTDVEKQAKKTGQKKVLLPLGAKFSFFVGLLLVVIMIIVTVYIYNWAGDALEKEVKEKGIAIAKNIANNTADPLLKNDDLPLVILTKEAVQSPMTKEVADAGLLSGIIGVIKNDLLGLKEAEQVKNEGILGAVIVKSNGYIISADNVKLIGTVYELPEGAQPIKPGLDVFVQDYTQKGLGYIDIYVPVATVLNGEKYTIGEVHLTIARSVVTKVVTGAVVKIGLIILTVLFVGIIVSIMLVNFMVRPIGFLVKGVRAIGEGNYDVEIKSKSNDELGLLTDIFNDTAKSLKEKELLKGAFSRYVSSEVMNEVLNDPTKLSLHGKRVRATMLFTDIRGFTAMSETMQPEEVVAVINEYLTVQTDKVFKWKGVLDKFVGDCVMAVYGVPMPKDDDSYRAVRTAMDIRESVDKLNVIRKRVGQITVGLGIGVNTGDVVSGNMGSPQKMDYTVIGDNVNLAARLEANAPAGRVYVSESTYLETKDRIEFKELDAIMVKGKKEPVRVFEPIKVIEASK